MGVVILTNAWLAALAHEQKRDLTVSDLWEEPYIQDGEKPVFPKDELTITNACVQVAQLPNSDVHSLVLTC